MYISLRDSCSKGFNKWSEAHRPETKKNVQADGGDNVVVANWEHSTYLQLQYSQLVILIFNNILWPHVTVATMTLSAG
jgi:hypothetical protein